MYKIYYFYLKKQGGYMKTKNIILLIFVSALIVFTNSCRKPSDGCTWQRTLTNMHTGLCRMQTPTSYEETYGACIGIDSLDTCKYDYLKIRLTFESAYVSQNTCSSPQDSIIGKIEDIIVICENDYNDNYKINDTINDILNVIYTNSKGMPIASPLPLNDYLQTNPICSDGIDLFLSQPPNITSTQSFKIYYKETDGKMFSATTVPIYIMP